MDPRDVPGHRAISALTREKQNLLLTSPRGRMFDIGALAAAMSLKCRCRARHRPRRRRAIRGEPAAWFRATVTCRRKPGLTAPGGRAIGRRAARYRTARFERGLKTRRAGGAALRDRVDVAGASPYRSRLSDPHPGLLRRKCSGWHRPEARDYRRVREHHRAGVSRRSAPRLQDTIIGQSPARRSVRVPRRRESLGWRRPRPTQAAAPARRIRRYGATHVVVASGHACNRSRAPPTGTSGIAQPASAVLRSGTHRSQQHAVDRSTTTGSRRRYV